ncbi:MAG: hypothetical protein ABEJ61_00895 [Haloferacaceae archaeon]
MLRRRSLAVGGLLLLVVLAGCSAAGSLSMQSAADDATLAAAASRSPPPVGEASDGERVVREAIENGSATVEGRSPPVESGLPFEHDGRYYNLSWSVVDRRPGTSVRVGVDYNGTAPDAATVAYGELSNADRAMLAGALPRQTDNLREGPDFGVAATYSGTERDRSVLLDGEYGAVRYEGETYPVTVEDTERVTIESYRYIATEVADSSAAYAGQLRSAYLFTLSGLSDAERAVVEAAIDDTYYADSSDDEAFRAVLEIFRRHDAVRRTEYRGTWLVSYEGESYVAELSYQGFDLS